MCLLIPPTGKLEADLYLLVFGAWLQQPTTHCNAIATTFLNSIAILSIFSNFVLFRFCFCLYCGRARLSVHVVCTYVCVM